MANWAQLLPELLALIVKKLDLYEDLVSFGGVCRMWRSLAVKDHFKTPSPCSAQPPWLMLAEKETEPNLRGFVSLSKGTRVQKLALPEAQGKRCIGSLGWLITLDEQGGMELLHPLTRAKIHLPHLNTLRFFKEGTENHWMDPVAYLLKATLSASPSATNDYALMLILGARRNLAFWRPGNTVWTLVETSYHDVVYYRDMFYATSFMRNVVVCDVQGPNQITPRIVGRIPPDVGDMSYGHYLVDCCGDFLLVKKFLAIPDVGEDEYWTSKFVVCKATDSINLTKWQVVNDLGGASIFVGHGAAVSVPSAATVGVKPNCIYFTDDNEGYTDADHVTGGKDMDIYNLGSGAIEPLYGRTSVSKYCPPIWVSPSF